MKAVLFALPLLFIHVEISDAFSINPGPVEPWPTYYPPYSCYWCPRWCLPRCPVCPKCGGGIIFRLNATADVWLEGSGNKNNYNFLIVGKHPQYAKKRSLIKFENIPSSCNTVKSAKMYLQYWYSHKASWQTVTNINRTLQVHQVKKQWREKEATSINRCNGVKWNQPYVALDNKDANATKLDSVYFETSTPGLSYVEFDISKAAKNWKSGRPNYGVLIWATNEDTDARDIHFFSREHSTGTPYVHLHCS